MPISENHLLQISIIYRDLLERLSHARASFANYDSNNRLFCPVAHAAANLYLLCGGQTRYQIHRPLIYYIYVNSLVINCLKRYHNTTRGYFREFVMFLVLPSALPHQIRQQIYNRRHTFGYLTPGYERL